MGKGGEKREGVEKDWASQGQREHIWAGCAPVFGPRVSPGVQVPFQVTEGQLLSCPLAIHTLRSTLECPACLSHCLLLISSGILPSLVLGLPWTLGVNDMTISLTESATGPQIFQASLTLEATLGI